ncbi:MAG: TRIC cation channel family protein [Actinomycetales bacterium]|nr:TRIC cation channel family protein [Actinomycetales bacterium]
MERWVGVAHTAFVLAGRLRLCRLWGAAGGPGSGWTSSGSPPWRWSPLSAAACCDLLIGAVPPAALTDGWLLVVALAGAAVVFLAHGRVRLPRRPMLVFDALGLGLFCVEGTIKGLAFGLDPYAATIVSALTGVGGGVVRDMLSSEVPSVFRQGSRLYVIPRWPVPRDRGPGAACLVVDLGFGDRRRRGVGGADRLAALPLEGHRPARRAAGLTLWA